MPRMDSIGIEACAMILLPAEFEAPRAVTCELTHRYEIQMKIIKKQALVNQNENAIHTFITYILHNTT